MTALLEPSPLAAVSSDAAIQNDVLRRVLTGLINNVIDEHPGPDTQTVASTVVNELHVRITECRHFA